MSVPWWKTAVVYQIYPRSFADASGDGVGDLSGITEHLDHLVWLGVDALWLSPFYRSPMADFGYDVADHCDVDPLFGSLEDFDRMLAAAHARGLRVIIDYVPAHTSNQHPWFVEARASRSSPKRDWYTWRDPGPEGALPNNWRAAFLGVPAWTLDEASGQYYLHSFLPEQPDLNWSNPEMVEAMLDVLRFWLDRGVDGFRADVVHNIGKDPVLADLPEERAPIPSVAFNDRPETHPLLRRIRKLLDSYPGDRMMVGEVILSTRQVATYYGTNDELHLSFLFPPMHAAWDAGQWRRRVERAQEELEPRGAWPAWVLSNHDQPRHRTRYGSEAAARSATVLLLSLPGTPFLYQGEELGLEDAPVSETSRVDPGGRDGCRSPIPWSPDPGYGWPATPWLPFSPEPDLRNVERLREDPDSILHLYRRMLAARRSSAALSNGKQTLLDAPEGVLAYRREGDEDVRIVAVNFTGEVRPFAAPGELDVEISSHSTNEARPFAGQLLPHEAVVLARNRSHGRDA